MAWIVKNSDGSEVLFDRKPKVLTGTNMYYSIGESVKLPSGSIEKLIGRSLTWNDEPVELK